MNKKITAIGLAALFAGLSIGNLCVPDKVYSERERRYLDQAPSLSWEKVFSGAFSQEFESYSTDQFFYRDQWVMMKIIAEQARQRKDSNGVYFGQDGYLIEQFDQYDKNQFLKNLEAISRFSQAVLEKTGIPADFLLIPNASGVLTDQLPFSAPEIDQAALFDEADRQVSGFYNVCDALKFHNQEEIYYRTDHHWTSLGAYYAYEEWRRQKGEEGHSLSFYQTECLTEQFYGTTFSKAGTFATRPDTIFAMIPEKGGDIQVEYQFGKKKTDSFYERTHLSTADPYSVFLDGNQPITKITTQQKNGKRLMLIKDSFANTFAQFLLNDYEEIYLIDLRSFQTAVIPYLEQYKITDILILYHLKGFCEEKGLFSFDRDQLDLK